MLVLEIVLLIINYRWKINIKDLPLEGPVCLIRLVLSIFDVWLRIMKRKANYMLNVPFEMSESGSSHISVLSDGYNKVKFQTAAYFLHK